MRKLRRKSSIIAAAIMLGACARGAVGEAYYSADQCRRVAITDIDSGANVVGIEDLAVDWETNRLFLAAYDRRATERAVRRKAPALPQGGLYTVALDALFQSDTDLLEARSLVAPRDITGGLHPHGVAYDAAHNELVFINRTYSRRGRDWVMSPRLQRIGADGEVFVGDVTTAHCAANNVLVTGGGVFTTFDHGACDNWQSTAEDVLRLKRSGLADANGNRLYNKAAFANGLTDLPGGGIALAATRENALLFLEQNGKTVTTSGRVDVPGGPDNLTTTKDGGIIAAVHPSMRRLAITRKLGLGKAPSRVVRITPQSQTIEILFDDPTGRIFSAATVALENENGLIAGSVMDEGLLVCREAM